jgi:pyridoxal phosphate enzyme (YggS family)
MPDSTAATIRENIKRVREQIEKASRHAGRDPSEIKLVAVSKTKPAEAVYEAYLEGLTAFGENYAQELNAKRNGEPLSSLTDIEWHMIGHIQTNKAKSLVGATALIHSLDSVRLAVEIQKQAEKASVAVDALIEVNIAKEANKFGFFAEETPGAIERIAALKNIRILGLMTSAPLTDDPEHNRMYFRQLNELYIDIRHKRIDNTRMKILSMGMSGDFEVAVEEGSTMLRIGTKIFGGR